MLTLATTDPVRRFRTLALRASVTYDASALARRAGGGASRGAAVGFDETARYTHRVWWAAPSRWRDDVEWPSGERVVSVVRDGDALTYISVLRTLYTSESVAAADGWEVIAPPRGIVELPTIEQRLSEFPLIRPRLPTSEWTFSDGPATEHLGRPCRRVYAVRRPVPFVRSRRSTSGYWDGVDEYECLVDDSLQVVVRLSGLADGAAIAAYAADELQVDEDLPADVFTFRPPAGTRVAHVVWRG